MTNVIVELAEDNTTAKARSYFIVFQVADELALQPIVAGRHHDEFVRKASGRQFLGRKMLLRLVGDRGQHQQVCLAIKRPHYRGLFLQ